MTMTATETASLKAQADQLFTRKKLTSFGLPALVLAYLTYIFISFDIPGLAQRFEVDNARALGGG